MGRRANVLGEARVDGAGEGGVRDAGGVDDVERGAEGAG